MLLPFLVCMWSTPLAKLHSPRQSFASQLPARWRPVDTAAMRAADPVAKTADSGTAYRQGTSQLLYFLRSRLATAWTARKFVCPSNLPATCMFALFSRCSLTD
jgi:hypothetical protein